MVFEILTTKGLNGGRSKQKFDNEYDEVLFEQQKRLKKENKLKDERAIKEPIIVIISRVYSEQGYQGIKELFKNWNQTEEKELLDEVNEIDFIRVLKILYNQYLNSFSDCLISKRTKIKTKKVKYGFDKERQRLEEKRIARENMIKYIEQRRKLGDTREYKVPDLTKTEEKYLTVEKKILEFVAKMEVENQ